MSTSFPLLSFRARPFGRHGLELVQDEALYWAGTTGGWGYDDRCPYPGSYCEGTLAFGEPNDQGDAFVARMGVQNLNVSVVEATNDSATMLAWPNPVTDAIQVSVPGFDKGYRLILLNELGQLVVRGQSGKPSISLVGLATGIYLLNCLNAEGVVVGQGKVLVK